MARIFRSAAALAMLAFAGLATAESPMRRMNVSKGEGGREGSEGGRRRGAGERYAWSTEMHIDMMALETYEPRLIRRHASKEPTQRIPLPSLPSISSSTLSARPRI
jgi:hypothetical protein